MSASGDHDDRPADAENGDWLQCCDTVVFNFKTFITDYTQAIEKQKIIDVYELQTCAETLFLLLIQGDITKAYKFLYLFFKNY